MSRRKAPALRLEAGAAVRFLVAKQTHVTEERPRKRDVPAGTMGVVEQAEVGGTVILVAVAVAPDGMTDAVVAGSSEVEVVGGASPTRVVLDEEDQMVLDALSDPAGGYVDTSRGSGLGHEGHEYCPECGVCQNDHGNPLRHLHLTTCSRHEEE